MEKFLRHIALAMALLFFTPVIATAKPAHGHVCPSLDETAQLAARTAKEAYDGAYPSPGGKFTIYYYTTGTSAPPLTSVDDDSIPDFVQLAAHVADSVLHQYALMGFDTTLRVSGRYPIEMLNLSSYGLTWSSPPKLQIDNDFAESFFATKGKDALRVTIAHELFHAIQFQYISYTSGISWWMEMTATFMEEVMYDHVNDYHQYLDPVGWGSAGISVFSEPGKGLYFNNGTIYPYGGAIFPIFLTEYYGSDAALDIIYDTFHVRKATSTVPVVASIEARIGLAIEDILAEFWVWNYFTGIRARDDFGFSEAASYRPAPLDPDAYAAASAAHTIESLPDSGTVRGLVGAAPLGAALIRIVPDGSIGGFRATLYDSTEGNWSWRIAIADENGVRRFPETPTPYDERTRTITIAGDNWTNATDIVLVGTNGVTTGGEQLFTFELKYDATLSSIAIRGAMPDRVVLGLNTPNPFNPSTTIPFSLPSSGYTEVAVYSVAGQLVQTLIDSDLHAGDHTVVWDGSDSSGRPAASGVYLVQLTSAAGRDVRRITLAR